MQVIEVNYYGSKSLIGEIIQSHDMYLNSEPYELVIDSLVIALSDLAQELAQVESKFGKKCVKLTVLGFDAVEGKYPRYVAQNPDSFRECPDCGYQAGDPFVAQSERYELAELKRALRGQRSDLKKGIDNTKSL